VSEGRTIHETTLLADGECVMVGIPREMADRAGLRAGEAAYAIETDGGILLVAADSPFARVMEADARISERYENALRDLAKGPSR
jgi:selenophosphate synthetase-related protein